MKRVMLVKPVRIFWLLEPGSVLVIRNDAVAERLIKRGLGTAAESPLTATLEHKPRKRAFVRNTQKSKSQNGSDKRRGQSD